MVFRPTWFELEAVIDQWEETISGLLISTGLDLGATIVGFKLNTPRILYFVGLAAISLHRMPTDAAMAWLRSARRCH